MQGDSGKKPEDGAMLPGQKNQPDVVSVGPPYSVADEKYQYQPKGSEPEAPNWKVKEGPSDMRVEDKQVSWTPDKGDKGVHHVVIEGKVKDKNIKQEYDITVAVPEKRAEAKASPRDGGEVKVSSPTSKIEGAAIKARPGSMRSSKTLSISEVDKAPPMANKDGELKGVQFGPKGQAFARPALVALPLPDDAVLDRSRVGAFVYNPAGRWERVRTIGIDLEHRFVFAEAEHFSVYAAAQSSLDMKVSVESMPAASSCEGTLIGRAEVGSPLADIESSALNKASPAVSALIENGASNMASLISAPGFTGSVRVVRVLDLLSGDGADAITIEQRLAIATLYVPGDGSAILRHTRSTGELVGELAFDNFVGDLSTVGEHLRGLATHVTFATAGEGAFGVSGRLHLVYAEGDASLDPISVDDLGVAAIDVAPSEPGTPDVAPNLDTDCDRLRNDFDSTDNRVLPRLAVVPDSVVITFVGAGVRLSGHVENLKDAPKPTWEVIAGDGKLSKVEDDEEARDFQADTAGRHQVELKVPGQDLSYVFVIDVLEISANNHAPTCTPSAGSLTAKLGETVGLSAVAFDLETATDSLTVEWGLVDDSGPAPVLVPNGQLEGFGPSAVLAPAATGAFHIGCRAFDGVTNGPIGQTDVSVLEANTNRLPEDLFLSPPSSTIETSGSVTLLAQGSDPDDDTLTFEWETSGGTLGPATSTKSSSKRTLTANAQGVIDVTVSISDGKGPPTVLSATVLVVADLDMLGGADADGDGFPAGTGPAFDCDDGNPARYPTAIDICGNETDEDCSGAPRVDDCDDDGFASPTDCQDLDPTINPDAFELCNGIDDNCLNGIDETFREALGATCSVGVGACLSQGAPTCASDRANVVCLGQPGNATDEICNGLDDDCDGELDEGLICDAFDGGMSDGGVNDAGPTCVATNEVCNGLDDDCDLAIDEDFASSRTECGTGACAASGETSCADGKVVNSCEAALPESLDNDCNGVDEDCNGRNDDAFPESSTSCGRGVCVSGGSESCVNGEVSNSCIPGPQAASTDTTCNEVDDDCDGPADEDFASSSTICGLSACASGGAITCVAGKVVDSCQARQPRAPNDTTCDNFDDDCDEIVDEDYVPVGTECGSGACFATGTTSCVNGKPVDSCKSGVPASSDTTCDGIDQDCNGTADEDYVALDTNCGTGACFATGTTSCVNGKPVDSCKSGIPASSDTTCNNIDDDCNGAADEDYIALGTNCGTGACAATGATSCVNGGVVNSCTAGTPASSDAACDSIDEDCNGVVDDLPPSPCETAQSGACSVGHYACNGAGLLCIPNGAANTEFCNAIDDNCGATADEGGVCDVEPVTNSLVGVWFECESGACDVLRSHGLMFVAQPAANAGYSEAFSLKSSDNQSYTTDGPYCGEGPMDWRSEDDGDEDPATQILTVRWTKDEGTMPPCSQDLDCANGEICQDGRCASSCTVDSDCAAGRSCFAGGCRIVETAVGNLLLTNTDRATVTWTSLPPDPEMGPVMDLLRVPENSSGQCIMGGGGECQPAEVCGNGTNDDCDSFDKDADDPDCQLSCAEDPNQPACEAPGESCMNAINISAGGMFPSSIGQVNDGLGNCSGPNGLDRLFYFDVGAGGVQVTLGLTPTAGANLAFSIIAAPPGWQPDQGCPGGVQQGSCLYGNTTFKNYLPGGRYLVIVEGGPANAPFTLRLGKRFNGTCNPPLGLTGDEDGISICDGDCDDSDSNVNPQAADTCNGIDDNCNGYVDDLSGTCSTGLPGVCAAGKPSCDVIKPCQQIQAASPEDYCGDDQDNDCDGQVDELGCVDGQGESCSTAIPVGSGGTFSGTLAGKTDDAISGCGFSGAEVFYAFTVSNLGTQVVFSANTMASQAGRYVLYRDCDMQAMACGMSSMNLQPGNYLLAIEHDGSNQDPSYQFSIAFMSDGVCETPDGDGDGETICNGDCNDGDEGINRGASEGSKCDALDNDCNGKVDDLGITCSIPAALGVCAEGSVTCSLGVQGCMPVNEPDPQGRDLCSDSLDNDCDGASDDQDVDGCVELPAGDICSLAIDVSAGGTFEHTLVGYHNDVDAGCSDGGGGVGSGLERFYSLTLTDKRRVRVVASANADVYVAIAWHNSCATTEAPSFCDGSSFERTLDPGTYRFAVFSGQEVGYRLSVSTQLPEDHGGGSCVPADTDDDGFNLCNGDCAEGFAGVFPGAREICNGVDDNCNGNIDDETPHPACASEGVGECAVGHVECNGGTDACVADHVPGQDPDVCGDGKDNNCDGNVDEPTCSAPDAQTCVLAVDLANGDPYIMGTMAGATDDTTSACAPPGSPDRFYRFTVEQPGTAYLHVLPLSAGAAPPFMVSLYRGDCAGNSAGLSCFGPGLKPITIPEPGTYYVVLESSEVFSYEIQFSTSNGGTCSTLDVDEDGFDLCSNDCDDSSPSASPGLSESCDGVDNNCDGAIDNLPATACETGLLGICAVGTATCSGASAVCQPLNTARANDICGDALDNDCDGETDELGCEALPAGETCELAIDVTGGGVYAGSSIGALDNESACGSTGLPDTFYRFTLNSDTYVHLDVKSAGEGGPVQFYTSLFSGGCSSRNAQGCFYPAIHGQLLSAGTYFFFVEANLATDYNLFVAFSNGETCFAGEGSGDFDADGTTLCDNDCDESNFSVHPGAGEVCNNGADDDCNGDADNIPGVVCISGQAGDCSAGLTQCPQVGSEPVCVPVVQPGARPELCDDGIDNDCDGPADDSSECVTATGNSCALAIDITNAPNGKVVGTITDPNDDAMGCGRQSPELVYRVTPTVNGTLFMNIVGDPVPGNFSVRSADGGCDGSAYCQQAFGSRTVTGGVPVFVTVEGPLGVPFQLTFANRPGESPQGPCFDGVGNTGSGNADGDSVALCQGDCNEAKPTIYPGADEICGDQVDDNCDGTLDFENRACNTGLPGICADGLTHCIVSNEPASCDSINMPQEEVCNAQDDNCDGLVDEANVCGGGCEPQPEICNNGIDDDCDTLPDPVDPDCLPPPP